MTFNEIKELISNNESSTLEMEKSIGELKENIEVILDKLHLLTDVVPNNAAATLFSNNINEYPQFKLRMLVLWAQTKMSSSIMLG